MDSILQIVRQEDVEKRFSRKHVDAKIRQFIKTDKDTQAKIQASIERIQQWMDGDYYDSKKARLAQLKTLNLPRIVEGLFTGLAYVLEPEVLSSVCVMLSGRVGFDDKRDAVQTVAELLAIICFTDACDITKEGRNARLMIQSTLTLDKELKESIYFSQYLPPMVCEPLEVKTNYDSGYLSIKESLILGKGNHHDGNICLDVINTVNRVALKLDTDFLRSLDEKPGNDFTIESVKEKGLDKGKHYSDDEAALILSKMQESWPRFKADSNSMYMLMHNLGNEFYLTHKVDKRGRIYSQGYQINTQGSSYKKASVELAKEELITGVPV